MFKLLLDISKMLNDVLYLGYVSFCRYFGECEIVLFCKQKLFGRKNLVFAMTTFSNLSVYITETKNRAVYLLLKSKKCEIDLNVE